jgi:hypothetical protein
MFAAAAGQAYCNYYPASGHLDMLQATFKTGLLTVLTGWYLFSANAAFTSPMQLNQLGNVKGVQFNGIAANDQAGYTVAAAGDVNGDGIDDVIFGSEGISAGQSYVVFGNTSFGSSVFELSSLTGANGFILNGVMTLQWVSGAGDVNGDGYDDVLIGSRYADPPGKGDAGITYLVFGRASFSKTIDLNSLDGSNGVKFHGRDAGEWSGYQVSGAGDVNGDGFDDILIGAPYADVTLNDQGRTYLVFGKASFSSGIFELSSLTGSNGVAFIGIGAGDNMGRAVSGAGDVNGDGFDDILIAAEWSDQKTTDAGQVYLVFGRATFSSATILVSSLNGNTGVIFNGIDIYDHAGSSVAGAGDVNGDGFADIIIGANYADPRGDAGETYVVFGRATFLISTFNLFNLDGTNGFIINGINAGDESGKAVSGGADVNGDGFADILVHAAYYDPIGLVNYGGTFVVFGKASFSSGFLELSALDGTNGFALFGVTNVPAFAEKFGACFAGDVNGDGRPDILVGDRWSDPNGKTNAGGAYLVFSIPTGSSNGELRSINKGLPGFTIYSDASVYSGYSVSNAGDFNGDGIDDVLVSAHWALARAGETYIVFGKEGVAFDAITVTRDLNGKNGIKLNGILSGAESSYCLSGAGDVNGDGFDDILVGVYNDAYNGMGTIGSTYLVFGKASFSKSSYDLGELDGIRMIGEAAQDRFGWAVAGAGDVNGDGYADMIISAIGVDFTGRGDAGRAYVVFGKRTFASKTLLVNSLDGSNGFKLNGVSTSDQLGSGVACAGDVNGDGYDDVIIGARYVDTDGKRDAGAAYLVFGKATFLTSTIELGGLDGVTGITLKGTNQDDHFGVSVSGAGDVNADGFDDIIVGAALSDIGAFDSGAAYVIFGKSTFTSSTLAAASLDGSNGFIMKGIDASDLAGFSVSRAGDFNGDGFDDVVIGAYSGDGQSNTVGNCGETYVVFGRASFGAFVNFATLDGDNGLTLFGIGVGGTFSGYSVSGGGDVNGDGLSDIIIGAHTASPYDLGNAGETYVVFGGARCEPGEYTLAGSPLCFPVAAG